MTIFANSQSNAEMRCLWIWFIIFVGPVASAVANLDDSTLERVGQSRAWLKLLHYEQGAFGRTRSLLDGPEFFFAQDGATNPVAELKATISAFNQDIKIGKLKQHPQCAFPERLRWIEEQLPIRFVKVECPLLGQFLERFNNPHAISVVFSSAYPNNPASMFGHTFLKVHSKDGTDLLDSGINFAAMVSPDENGLAFMYLGTTGGYLGQWSVMPYYVKVNEYSDFESRDLWEYELNLTPDEVRRFLTHVWELETNSYFEYFFFDENCSYQILAALTAIKPEWEILFHRIYVIPGETIKNLAFHDGVVRRVKMRPSAHNRLFQRLDVLDHSERREFMSIIAGEKDFKLSQSRMVLDTVAAYFDYVRNEKKKIYEQEYQSRREDLLIHRATLGIASDAELKRLPPLVTDTRPDLGHDPYVAAFGSGWRDRDDTDDGSGVLSFRLKSAYHDLLNKDLGFTRLSQIDFPWFELQYDEWNERVRLEELGGIRTISLHPWSVLDRRPSWRFGTALLTARDYGCDSCLHWTTDAAGGMSYALSPGRWTSFLMAGLRVDFYRRLNRGYRYGPLIEAGLLWTPQGNYKLKASVLNQWDLDQNQRSQSFAEVRIDHAYSLSRNREIRQTNIMQVPEDRDQFKWWESRLELLFFFR